MELNSGSQDCKTSHCEVLLPEISARLQAVPCVILVQWFSPERSPSYPVLVGFGFAEMACVSPNVRTTRSESFASFGSNVPFLGAKPHTLYFSIKVFMVLFEKSTVRMAVFNGSVIIFFRIRIGMKTAKAFCVIIYTQIEFKPRLQKMVTSNTASPICSHLSGLLYKKYP